MAAGALNFRQAQLNLRWGKLAQDFHAGLQIAVGARNKGLSPAAQNLRFAHQNYRPPVQAGYFGKATLAPNGLHFVKTAAEYAGRANSPDSLAD